MMRILTLMENGTGARRGLTAEHGLSFAVDADGMRILFDCGSSENTVRNGRFLNVSPASVDILAFSHSHYDHAAGFRAFAERGLSARAVIGSCFFEEKYAAAGNGTYSYLGCGFSEQELRACASSVTVNERTVRLTEHCTLETDFPRIYDWETIPERFVRLTERGMEQDQFPDEQCLVLETGKGLAVVTGCSHPGILNMVTEIGRRYGKPVTAVIGGLHLSGAGGERISRTAAGLKKLGVTRLWCNHCTGREAREQMAADPQLVCGNLAAGDCIFLE